MDRNQLSKIHLLKMFYVSSHLLKSWETPFAEESQELFTIHSKDVVDGSVIETVRNVTKIGAEQHQAFVKEQFVDRSKAVTEPLKKYNLVAFSTSNKKVP